MTLYDLKARARIYGEATNVVAGHVIHCTISPASTGYYQWMIDGRLIGYRELVNIVESAA